MNMIVNVDNNWAIGYRNSLLVRIPSDMKFFRQETTGKVIVMGRKTLESFPGGQPLKNRINIVLTTYDSENIYVIGGESIYRQLLPYCDTAHVTRVCNTYQADTWFPNLDELPDWELTGESEEQTYFDLEYYFLRYERKKK